jgi:hypothetical protein
VTLDPRDAHISLTVSRHDSLSAITPAGIPTSVTSTNNCRHSQLRTPY